MTIKVVQIVADQFKCTIQCPEIFRDMPIANVRKLFKLMYKWKYDNNDTIDLFRHMFPKWIDECQDTKFKNKLIKIKEIFNNG